MNHLRLREGAQVFWAEDMAKDLGTYHVKVELADGRGWIQTYHTGARFTGGREHCHPLNSLRIRPVWGDEDKLIDGIRFQFLEGNYSCDCNKKIFLANANQEDLDDEECGDTMPIKRLTLIRPDGDMKTIYEA
jgi:hypothetical protein